MPNFTKKQRQEVEKLVCESMDILDKSKTNGDYYRQLFANMSDTQFYNFIKKELPFRFQYIPTTVEPTMSDAIDTLKHIGVPLIENLTLPYLYTNKDGKPVGSQPAMVCYVPLKKVQQFVTKKNKWATESTNRDMKSGRLIGSDKGASESDREFESLATLDLNYTMKELAGPRADALDSKNIMYNTIGTTGMVRLSDLPDNIDDSLSRNMFNVYLIGAGFNSNLINQDNYTMYTVKERRRKGVTRN